MIKSVVSGVTEYCKVFVSWCPDSADANCDFNLESVAANGCSINVGAATIRNDMCVLAANIIKNKQEFVTAHAAKQVVWPQAYRHASRHFEQNTVTDEVPIIVIYLLEVIDIDTSHGDAAPVSILAGKMDVRVSHAAAIQKPR